MAAEDGLVNIQTVLESCERKVKETYSLEGSIDSEWGECLLYSCRFVLG